MDNQVPMSQAPIPQPPFQAEQENSIAQPSPFFDLEAMKAQARDLAIQQVLAARSLGEQQEKNFEPVAKVQKPEVVYVRRNLTVAELIVVFAIACGIVYAVPNLINLVTNNLPKIEIKVKR